MYVSLLSETQFKENKIEKLITRQNLVENVIGISLPVTGELTYSVEYICVGPNQSVCSWAWITAMSEDALGKAVQIKGGL